MIVKLITGIKHKCETCKKKEKHSYAIQKFKDDKWYTWGLDGKSDDWDWLYLCEGCLLKSVMDLINQGGKSLDIVDMFGRVR